MRKLATSMMITIFIAQFMMGGILGSISQSDDLEPMSSQTSETSGRQAPLIGCEDFDGFAGPVWEHDNEYSTLDIVEYPPNTGNFYILSLTNITNMNTTMSPVENNSADLWSGPCTCSEIAVGGGTTWELNQTYYPWQIVSWNSTYWVAQDAGAPVDEEPGNEGASGASSDFWKPCSSRCSTWENSADGMGGPVWQNGSYYYTNEIVEWPANSGQFWQMTFNGSNDPPEAVQDGDWIGPCTCFEIAEESGIVWDPTISYDPWQILEHNGSYWIAQGVGAPLGEEPRDEDASGASSDFWKPCSRLGPCSTFNGSAGPVVWDSTASYSPNDTVEWPANSGEFWQSTTSGPTGEPNPNGKWIGPCTCKDIWADSTSSVWDSNTVYDAGMLVEFPAGSEDIWIAITPSTTAGVDPTFAWADGNEWELCSSGEPDGGPCAGLNVVGVWDSSMQNVTSGDIYEYSGLFYQVNPGSPFWSVSAPDVDLDVWSPIDCPCEETWDANGQPVWDSTITYPINSVVEWPAGSLDLWIAIAPSTTAGVDPTFAWADGNEWKLCSSDNSTDGGPCAGLDVVGVWDSSMQNVTSGDIYEYSGLFYQVNPGGPFWNVNAPDIDLDVWSPIDCPCKETWDANGQPVWDSSQYYYTGYYVVEWPAGSDNLYMSEGGGLTGAGEPGVDTHWTLCEGDGPSPGPCDGLDVSVWDNTTVPAVGDIYQYPAYSGTYYEIIFTHENASGGPDWVANPVVDGSADEFWKPHICPCEETWAANGEPVWDSTISFYQGNYVVEWPAGSHKLYLAEGGGITGAGEPGVDGHWIPCDGQGPSLEPCDGVTSAGIWNSTTLVEIGEIYEFSGMFYQVVHVDPDGTVSTSPGDDQDYEFWTPYVCPCKETWDANGQPVWDNSISNYPGNYVVEWPAGSDSLYISVVGGVTGVYEPSQFANHWLHCDDSTKTMEPEKESKDGLPSIGVFGTIVSIMMGVIVLNRRLDD